MQSGSRRVLFVAAAVGLALVVGLVAECGALPISGSADDAREALFRHGSSDTREDMLPRKASTGAADTALASHRRRQATALAVENNDSVVSEEYLIHDIELPFKQLPDWERTGISLTATGEPKSGTTWLARVVVELSLQLCGNPENTWCQMGGLNVTDRPPAPRYEFEMLNADTGDVYLHFQGVWKHVVPGLEESKACAGGGIPHHNSFENFYPCNGASGLTRAELTACLPTVTPECTACLPPLDPARRRWGLSVREWRRAYLW